jgi:hypothetical protein
MTSRNPQAIHGTLVRFGRRIGEYNSHFPWLDGVDKLRGHRRPLISRDLRARFMARNVKQLAGLGQVKSAPNAFSSR